MLAIVRIRGGVGRRKRTKDALDILGLSAPNNCIVVEDSPSFRGALQEVKDYVAFGQIDLKTLTCVLSKRGRLAGGKKLSEETVKETGYNSVDELAKSIFEGKTSVKKVPNLKPVFRLSPPSKGFKSVKEQHPKGDLGNKKESINGLIKRMV